MSVSFLHTVNTQEYEEDIKKCERMRKHSGTTVISETMSITWQGDKPRHWDVQQETASMKEQEKRGAVQLRLMRKLRARKLGLKIEGGSGQGSQ
jgi:hypothetical protein